MRFGRGGMRGAGSEAAADRARLHALRRRNPFADHGEERLYFPAPSFDVANPSAGAVDPVFAALAGDGRREPISRTDVRQSLWILVAGLFFALTGVVVKYAAAEFSAAEFVFYRSLLQMLVAWTVLSRIGMTLKTTRLHLHFRRSVFGFLSLFMFFHSLAALPVATAMTLNYTSPVFLAVMVAWIARRRPGAGLIATVAAGLLGALLLLRPSFDVALFWPALIALASGALNALAFWDVRKLVSSDEPEGRVVFYFSLFALLGSLLWMAPQTWQPVRHDNVLMLVAVAAFGTAGQLAMTRAFGKGKTLVTAVLSYSGIVFGSVLGIAVFGDALPLLAWAGIALIVAAGVMAVQVQPKARSPRTAMAGR